MKNNSLELLTDVTVFKHKLWTFEYADRMDKWFQGIKQAPIRIDAELHTRCNLNCRMCARRGSIYEKLTEEERNRIEISVKNWVQIAEEAGKMGVRAWNISGLCEPLVKPEVLFPTMRMIKAYDMFGELTTNGTLWNEKYIKKTIEMGWDSVCISIDAPNAEVHDYLRGVKGTFQKATKTFKDFGQMKKKYKVNLPILTLNVVLNKLNYLKLKEIVEMTYNLGGDAIFVEPMVVFGSLGEPLKMGVKEIDKFLEIVKEAKELANNYGILLDITAIAPGKTFSGEKRFDKALIEKAGNMRTLLIDEAKSYTDKILSIPCYYPWFFMMIRADGSAVHCGEWKSIEENIKNKNLAEIWFGKRFSEIREQFKEGKLAESCEKCRPNVIEDTRIVRKSIREFGDINFLRGKYLELLEENKRIKQELFLFKRKGYENNAKCVQCRYKKELYKFQNSLTFKVFSYFWKTKIEKIAKKIFGR
jgi:MoaA/NifB/PqqE/SkfB family radical SAM enzyme